MRNGVQGGKPIIFINRYFYPDGSATSQLLSDLAFELAAKDFSVTVITSRQTYQNPSANLASFVRIKGVTVHRVRTTTFGRQRLLLRVLDYVSFYLFATLTLFRLAGSRTTVVTKTDPPLMSIFSAIIVRLRGATAVNWLQDLFPEVAQVLRVKGVPNYLYSLLIRARNWSLSIAATNVVLGNRMEAYVKGLGIRASTIKVIHNWSDGVLVYPVPHDQNVLRQRWGIGNRFVVGYSGNLGRAHDLETMVGAIRKMELRRDIVFLFIGAGKQFAELQSLARRLNVCNIMFQPYQAQEDLRFSLGAADVHLISLKPELEGLIVPSKVYGILAAGKPFIYIGDERGEVAQIAQQAECGMVIRQGDSAGLVEAITRMEADRAGLRRMGLNARAWFDTRYEKKVALQKWEDLLAFPAG